MEALLERIRKIKRLGPLSIGVNGIDASGKSHFAQALAQWLVQAGLDVQVVHGDDFHLPKEVRSACELSPPECYYRQTFNWARLEDEVLQPIHLTGSLHKHLAHLNYVTNEYSTVRKYAVTPETVVIVEGVFLFEPRLARYFGYKIFLDISEDECMRRVVERDGHLFGERETILKRYREKYLPGQRLYLHECQPKSHADVVIDNNDFTRPVFLWKV